MAAAETDDASGGEREAVHQALEMLAEDYRSDPMALDGTFGIRVDDNWWTVSVDRHQEAYRPNERLTFHNLGPHQVTLSEGMPSEPTWYFHVASAELLQRIAAGEISAGTAAMQSFGSDQVGVEIEQMEGFEMNSGHEGHMYLALSHFWTTGVPEITRFSRDSSLPTHGVAAVALHMMKGFRVTWFSIGPNEVANADERLEEGQVPNLFIVTRGRGRALLGDGEVELSEGMSVFVPQYVRHVISNPYDEPLEGVLILYGDNSDFAFGTSYPEFMESMNQFYGEYPFRRD